MRHLVAQEGLNHRVVIDSAGTGGWHSGNPADARMCKHAALRGYALESKARQLRESDFENFDLILVMDQDNLKQMKEMSGLTLLPKQRRKVKMFCDFAEDRKEKEVPDPYYGGEAGFEQVLDIVENGCQHLIRHIRRKIHA